MGVGSAGGGFFSLLRLGYGSESGSGLRMEYLRYGGFQGWHTMGWAERIWVGIAWHVIDDTLAMSFG
jgi:hypothetical protein